MVNYTHYTYKVTWSEEDQEFVGLCAEFPSLSYLHKDQNATLKGIKDLVKDVVTDMESNEELVPEPLAEKTYSGKFQVRITPELHRKLSRSAEKFLTM